MGVCLCLFVCVSQCTSVSVCVCVCLWVKVLLYGIHTYSFTKIHTHIPAHWHTYIHIDTPHPHNFTPADTHQPVHPWTDLPIHFNFSLSFDYRTPSFSFHCYTLYFSCAMNLSYSYFLYWCSLFSLNRRSFIAFLQNVLHFLRIYLDYHFWMNM